MKTETPSTANPLRAAERKARLDALVKAGKVSPEHARLIDFREATDDDRAIAATLMDKAGEALARHGGSPA